MRRILPLFLLAACGHAANRELAVAPPAGSAPVVAARGVDPRVEGVMGVAWSHPTSYKPWASAGDSVLVLSEHGGDIDVIDARSGRARTFPLQTTLASIFSVSGRMAIATSSGKVHALDPTGGILWTTDLKRAESISQVEAIPSGVVVFQPYSDGGHPLPHVVALSRTDGAELWSRSVSSPGSLLEPLGPSFVVWSSAAGLVKWSVLDGSDGHVLSEGEESGSRLVTAGRKFIVCDEIRDIARVHSNGNEKAHPIAYRGRCMLMAVDEDTVYSMQPRVKEVPGEIEAIGMDDGEKRWLRPMPVATGAVVHGAWLLVPSDGGIVRALRRDTGALAWSYGVGARAMLTSFDPSTVIAAGDNSVLALRSMNAQPPERASDVTLHVTGWTCVDQAATTLFVGDVAAQPDGPDRFTARVQGRGRVLVRADPWTDIVPSTQEANGYAPLAVDIDGARHVLDVELDNCDED